MYNKKLGNQYIIVYYLFYYFIFYLLFIAFKVYKGIIRSHLREIVLKKSEDVQIDK